MDLSFFEDITHCPLCKSIEFKTKYIISGVKINQCKNCSFAYSTPQLKKEKNIELYLSNYFNNDSYGYTNYTKTEKLRKKSFSKWIKDAENYTQNLSTKTALDIGCAAGFCLEELKSHGFDAEGVELNQTYAKICRKKGFQIYNNPLLSINTNRRYAFITLFDVLEHLNDVGAHLAKIYTLLEKDGIVVIVTPNYGSIARKILGSRWFQFKPLEHINYFTLPTLKRVAKENKFKLVSSKKTGQYCDKAFLADRLSAYRFSKVSNLFSSLVFLLLGKKFVYIPTSSIYVILKK